MVQKRSSSDNKRRNSPKKNKERREKQTVVEQPKEEPVPAPSSSTDSPPVFARRSVVVRRVMEPLPVDLRIQGQIKAAEIAYMATQFVMAVCFIFVPYTCYKSMFYIPPQEQMGMGGEPWEHYFELV